MEVEPETLINTISALQKNPSIGAVGGNVYWKGGEKNTALDRPRAEDRMLEVDAVTYIEALYSRYIATYKSVFWHVGGYDEKVFNMRGEGSDLSIRYWRAGYPLAFDSSIVVHHVHDGPESAALRVNHPEWGIAKDLLLLGYKYDMFNGEYLNFIKTVAVNFQKQEDDGYYRLLEGIGRNIDFIIAAKPILDAFRKTDVPAFNFNFLEVFSDKKLLNTCIATAAARIAQSKKGDT